MSVLVGLDRLPHLDALLGRLRHGSLGVLTHAAACDRRLHHLLDVLADVDVTPQTLFGPEHGFGGAAQDMDVVGDARHASGARIVSLYGDSVEELIPRQDDLAPLDTLLIDLVDIGSRYYTFVWTALLAVRAAAEVGVHCVILDRPNPIDGVTTEGRTIQDGFHSFVGWEKVPVRHGLTLGEMVALHADVDLGRDGVLSLVPVEGWDRAAPQPRWGQPWVLPSPNMPTWETAEVYPGGCLLEGTNLSEGRGHTRPFEFCGAPWLDGRRWSAALADTGLEGFVARPVEFIPTVRKHAGEACGGIQLHVTDRSRFRPVATYTALIALAHHQAPDDFRFRTERYEYVDDIPAFDLLTGSPAAREAILAGAPAREVAEAVSTIEPGWSERRREARERAQAAAW